MIWGDGWVKATEFPSIEMVRFQKRRNDLRAPSPREKGSRTGLAQAWVTGLGVGYLPVAPATWGSLLAAIIVLAVHLLIPDYEVSVRWVLVVVIGVPGFFFATEVCRAEENPDPSWVVIDEIVGQMLVLLWVPVSMFSLIAGFALFRLFDIVKPFPIRQSERLPGVLGIFCDDLVASLYAGIGLNLLTRLVVDT